MAFYNYFSYLFNIGLENYLFKENDVFYFVVKNTNEKIIIPEYLEQKIKYKSDNKIYNICENTQHHCITVFKKCLKNIYLIELLIGYRIVNNHLISLPLYNKNDNVICKIFNKNTYKSYNIYLKNFSKIFNNLNLTLYNHAIIIKPDVTNYRKVFNYYMSNKK